jgi:hypothetical protein
MPRVAARLGHRLALQQDLPGALLLQAGQDAHQRGLAAARGSDDAKQLAPVRLKIDVLERGRHSLSGAEELVEMLHVENDLARLQAIEARTHLRALLEI